MEEGVIVRVTGPVVIAEGMPDVRMYDVVRVGRAGLIGEVIELPGGRVTIQVYEETGGVGPGEPVVGTGAPLSVELAPGLVSSIYDGIQRPLDIIKDKVGDYIVRGVEEDGINRDKKWAFEPRAREGDEVEAGDILGVVQETPVVEHRVLVPPGLKGRLTGVSAGEFSVEEVIARLEDSQGKEHELTMLQRWPVRRGRPFLRKLPLREPLSTGQRVIDTFFPIAKGGVACIPGPFGSGKTVVQHQLSKWADAEIIVFIGCGERGNEMTDVLIEFPQLTDPRTGKPLMQRTVLIANTSNMPVAAREASVYTGITIAEYFRDMGYSVALMADSTSRWAEAMREISGRLEEMPGEEGYPAYLGTRIASFYERSGRVTCLGKEGREGSLSIIGAVSPPGGDLSEPVTQNTLRTVQVFWGLEDRLANMRHFPAINWLLSYSQYIPHITDYLRERLDENFPLWRTQAMALLTKEAELEEIVRLVGIDALSPSDRLVMETAKSLREDFLHQNAFHEEDTYTSLQKQAGMLQLILKLHERAQAMLDEGASIDQVIDLPVRARIARAKYVPEEEAAKVFTEIAREIEEETVLAEVREGS